MTTDQPPGPGDGVPNVSSPPTPVDDLAAQSLRRGNTLRLRARGGSMLPFLLDGDVLIVRPVPVAQVRVGDVICYEPPAGGLCLHRVVARRERGFVTRGDALTYVEVVPDTSVLGRVVARERHGRCVALDSLAARLRARVIARLAPALGRLLPLARGVRRRLRAVRHG
jgi:signal peptidase I